MHSSDKIRRRDDAGLLPLWALALTVALLAAGFRLRRLATAAIGSENKPGRPVSGQDRGRLAGSPSGIPARGWKDILLRIWQNISEHRVVALAAGITFYSLLAIFPAIAALVAIYGLFADPTMIGSHLRTLSDVLPGGAIEIVQDQLTRVASQRGGTLGVAFAISLAISLWSANAAMKSLFDTLNIVYSEKEKRSFVRLNAVSLAFTAAGIALALLALGVTVALPPALQYLGLSQATELIARIGRWPALFVIVAVALAIVYRYGPSRNEPRWRWISWGSMFAALAWLAASILFSWYAQNFGSFNKTYGSLGAVIGFMTWIWLSAIVILIGAELDAEMEHQTAQDARSGPRQPMGRRHTGMPDTAGAAQGR